MPKEMAPPPLPEDHRDAENIRLLSIFHYVAAGLGLAGLLGLILHFFLMRTVFGVMSEIPKNAPVKVTQPASSDPVTGVQADETLSEAPSSEVPVQDVEFNPEVFSGVIDIFGIFYLAFAIFIILKIVLNIMSARYLGQRRNRGFSMVTAGLNCLSIPLGTILGVFTLVVLSRESVGATYRKVEEGNGSVVRN